MENEETALAATFVRALGCHSISATLARAPKHAGIEPPADASRCCRGSFVLSSFAAGARIHRRRAWRGTNFPYRAFLFLMSTIATRRAQAKRRWLAEWDAWAATNICPGRQATQGQAFGFYTSRKNVPGLGLNDHSAIPWDSVHGWLLESDKLAG
jgi:hypothetical protein